MQNNCIFHCTHHRNVFVMNYKSINISAGKMCYEIKHIFCSIVCMLTMFFKKNLFQYIKDDKHHNSLCSIFLEVHFLYIKEQTH